MEEPPVLKEDIQDRPLCALQVAAVSGFVGNCKNIQASCLILCNVCRNGVPAPKLTIAEGVASSILAELVPGNSGLKSTDRSRVLPYRRVLKVHWIVPTCGRSTSNPYRFRDEQRREQTRHLLNIDMTEVKWPTETTQIVLWRFDRSIKGTAWPAGLARLAFCNIDHAWHFGFDKEIFNQPLDGVTFPAGLRELFLGSSFNQPIDNVVFPEGLERLSMPGFNHCMKNVNWPAGLKILELLDPINVSLRKIHVGVTSPYDTCGFNRPLGATLPSTLKSLWLSDDFNQAIDDVVWPTNLVNVAFGKEFRYCFLSGIVWPSTLQRLCLYKHRHSMEQYGELPENCKVAVLGDVNDSLVEEDGEGEEFLIDVEQFGDEYDNEYMLDGVIDDDVVGDDFVL